MDVQKPGSCLGRYPHVHAQRCRNLSPRSCRNRHRRQPTGKRAPGTHAARGQEGSVSLGHGHGHAHAQASVVGKLPNQSPWGASSLRGPPRCAFSRPCLSHFTPVPGSPELEARAFLIRESPRRGASLVLLVVDPCVVVFSPRKLLQGNSCRAAARLSLRCGPPLPHLPFLGQELEMALYSVRKCPGR